MKPGFRLRYYYSFKQTESGPVVVKCDQDSNATVVTEHFKQFLLACGFHPEAINKALAEVAAEDG